jgi:hypothetical protein
MTPEVPIGNLGLLLMIAGGGWLAVTNSGALLMVLKEDSE